jgi:hypothetical protein
MITIQNKITAPYFFQPIGQWIYRGFEFLSKEKKKFAFLQVMEFFGGATNDPNIEQRWKIYFITEDGDYKVITQNGIAVDISYLKFSHSEAVSKRKGLTAADVIELEKYAADHTLPRAQMNHAVIVEIQPTLVVRISKIQKTFAKVTDLQIPELVSLQKEIDEVVPMIQSFYPRSCEKLLDMEPVVRELYAKAKYPELYAEIEKFRSDKQHTHDEDDMAIGFGPAHLFGGMHHKYFSKSKGLEMWKLSSVFEKQFGDAVLFSEEVVEK